MPFSVLMVLPCTGSDTHTTKRPSFCTARISVGSFSRSLSAPMRTMMVRRPGMLLGFSASMMVSSSSGVHLSEIFTPRGFPMPDVPTHQKRE